MPFDGPPYLDKDEIRLIEDWIAQGARNANGVKSPIPAGAKSVYMAGLEQADNWTGLISLSVRVRASGRILAPGTTFRFEVALMKPVTYMSSA